MNMDRTPKSIASNITRDHKYKYRDSQWPPRPYHETRLDHSYENKSTHNRRKELH